MQKLGDPASNYAIQIAGRDATDLLRPFKATSDGAVAVGPSTRPPAAWANGSTPQDMTNFETVEIQVAGLSGGDSIAITRTLDGSAYVAQTGISTADLSTVASITADGIYAFTGGGNLKWAKTGSASTPTVTIRGSN